MYRRYGKQTNEEAAMVALVNIRSSVYSIPTRQGISLVIIALCFALSLLAWLERGSPASCCSGLRHLAWISVFGTVTYGALWVSWVLRGATHINRLAIMALTGIHVGLLVQLILFKRDFCPLCVGVAGACALLSIAWRRSVLDYLVVSAPGALAAFAALRLVSA